MNMASTKMKRPRLLLSPSSSSSSLSSLSSSSSSSTPTAAAAAAAASSSPCSPSSSTSTSTSCSSSSLCCSCGTTITIDNPSPVTNSHELELEAQQQKLVPKSKRRKRTRSVKAPAGNVVAAADDHEIKKESNNNNGDNKSITNGVTALPLPPHPRGRRSSAFRGVTRHRWTGRFEAHLWDKSSWNNMHNKKGRQVYLGAYDDEEAAARTYDLAALKYWGPGTTLNFPVEGYGKEMEEMEKVSKEEYLASLRRRSSGFSRGVSKYRGVARHHHNGRWEARIGRVLGNKYLYLGTFNTQEEAAEAYDLAALEYRGANAVTNFDVANYVDRLQAKGVNIEQFIRPSPPPPPPPPNSTAAAPQLEVQLPPPVSSPPPPEQEEEAKGEGAEEEVAMLMMMPPPPEMPPSCVGQAMVNEVPADHNEHSMISIEELLDLEHGDVLSGWSLCLEYPEVETAGCAGLPELFDDAGGFQLEDIDYLVFDAEYDVDDDDGKEGNEKPLTSLLLSDDDGSGSRCPSSCSTTTTTSVSCN